MFTFEDLEKAVNTARGVAFIPHVEKLKHPKRKGDKSQVIEMWTRNAIQNAFVKLQNKK